MWHLIRTALILLTVITGLTGLIYPLAVTGLAQIFFPHQANGSLIRIDDHRHASERIGQSFSDPRYFWGRPSATSIMAYNASLSAGSNLGPTNPVLKDAVGKRVAELQKADPQNRLPVPVDLVTSSGSGLDPQISPAAALYQVPRVARSRGLKDQFVAELVRRNICDRQFGLIGEPTVNVLRLNMALDAVR